MDPIAARVLGLVARTDYKPLTLRAMARRLELDPGDYTELRKTVKGLVRAGELAVGKDKTLRGAAAAALERAGRGRGTAPEGGEPGVKVVGKGAMLGTFRRSSRGFGFVRPKKGTGRENDIYIPADETLDASTGDEVAVHITKKSHKPGLNNQGRIVEVVTRASGLFVGTYFEEGGAGYVRVDGTTFHEPLYVGDPGAKGAKPDDKVAVEIARYPAMGIEGEGVITEILGPRGQPGVDTLTVLRALNIPDEFDDEVLQEARDQAKAFNEESVEGRLDLRETLTVTIDPADARDFDDAISLDRDDRGFWRLGIHIADVGHFVRANTALDRSARKRGTSVYLPGKVVPMLPEVISNALASLQEGKTRYTVSAILEISPEGHVTDRQFARTAIRVDKRFAYERAYEVMTNPGQAHEGVTPEVQAMLGRMLELAMLLRRRRFARGALELVMPEVEVDLGDEGQVVGAHLATDDESHQVIEEFMLAANEAVATHLDERKVGFLRRVHADPEPTKLKRFAEFARSLGYPIDDPQSRFELQRVLKESDDKPERYAVHYGFLRSLKQAIYSPEPEGHYALASEKYCHFTSPIRRYPDLQVHRQLVSLLAGKKPKTDPDELIVLGEHCTKAERRAEVAERELIKIKLLTHLEKNHLGDEFHAIIIGVEDFGFFCQLVELPVDGLVHVTSLGDDYYYLEAETHTLVGRRSGRRHRLGDRVEVRVARVDVDRRELDLVLAEDAGTRGAEEVSRPGDAESHLPPSRTAGRGKASRRRPATSLPDPPLRESAPKRRLGKKGAKGKRTGGGDAAGPGGSKGASRSGRRKK